MTEEPTDSTPQSQKPQADQDFPTKKSETTTRAAKKKAAKKSAKKAASKKTAANRLPKINPEIAGNPPHTTKSNPADNPPTSMPEKLLMETSVSNTSPISTSLQNTPNTIGQSEPDDPKSSKGIRRESIPGRSSHPPHRTREDEPPTSIKSENTRPNQYNSQTSERDDNFFDDQQELRFSDDLRNQAPNIPVEQDNQSKTDGPRQQSGRQRNDNHPRDRRNRSPRGRRGGRSGSDGSRRHQERNQERNQDRHQERHQERPKEKEPQQDYDEADLEDDLDDAKPGFRDRKRWKSRRPQDPPTPCEGLLELSPKGFGFLRRKESHFKAHPKDVFVLPDTVRHFGLREGMLIAGECNQGNRGPQLCDLTTINGQPPEGVKSLPYFEELTAINPDKRYTLETSEDRYTTRVIDLMTPIGRGQRGLIVAPPRTGKTTLLQHIAEAIKEKYEDTHLMIMLIDERPEEVTELRRALPDTEILASSNDNDVQTHIRLAEFGIERAKRLVEMGQHVFLLLDSITRLARSYNNATRGKGRTMSGGMDARALEMPRRLFAAARNTREAGSLTIIATALIQTNSKADELIFQEFKGTGNMELVLDRRISEQYIYPSIHIAKSGTRREELLLPPPHLPKIHLIRRGLAGHKPIEAIERLLQILKKFPNNAQMLMEIKATGY